MKGSSSSSPAVLSPWKPAWLAQVPKLYRLAFIGMCAILVVAFILYSFSVYLEKQVVEVGQETFTLQEENHDLELNLEQIKSFQHVSDSTKKIKGLSEPKAVINVVTEEASSTSAPVKAPKAKIPPSLYGY